MLTFVNLQDRMLRWLDEAGQSNTRTLVKDALNAAHRRVLLSRTWPFLLWPQEQSFVTTTGVKHYALHPSLGKILYIWDPSNRNFIPVVPRRQWENLGVDRTATSGSTPGVSFGPVWPVARQPLGSTITIVSSDLGDTAVTVYLAGFDANGNGIEETMTATGETPAVSTNSYTYLTRVTKVGTWLGTLTMTDASANTLLTLTASQPGKLYPTIEFVETPPAGHTITYKFMRPPDVLDRDEDLPNIFPNELAEIFVYDALLDMTTYNTELGQKEQILWRSRYDALYRQLLELTDEAILGSYPRFVRDVNLDSRPRMVVEG